MADWTMETTWRRKQRNAGEWRLVAVATCGDFEEVGDHDVHMSVIRRMHEAGTPASDTLEIVLTDTPGRMDGTLFRRRPLAVWYARAKIPPFYRPRPRKGRVGAETPEMPGKTAPQKSEAGQDGQG